MAENVISSDRNGTFQNPPDKIPTSSCSKRHASKATSSTWMELKKRKSPRGDPLAGGMKRCQKCSGEQCLQVTGKRKRSRVTIQEDSAKQLDASLAGIVNASFHLLTGLLGDSFTFSAPSMSTRRQPYLVLACLLEQLLVGISLGGF